MSTNELQQFVDRLLARHAADAAVIIHLDAKVATLIARVRTVLADQPEIVEAILGVAS